MPVEYRKLKVNCRLPGWMVAWLKDQALPTSMMIEDALMEKYNLTRPDIEE